MLCKEKHRKSLCTISRFNEEGQTNETSVRQLKHLQTKSELTDRPNLRGRNTCFLLYLFTALNMRLKSNMRTRNGTSPGSARQIRNTQRLQGLLGSRTDGLLHLGSACPHNLIQETLLMRLMLFLTFIVATASQAMAGDLVGVTDLNVDTKSGRPLSLTVWYPAGNGATRPVGGNAVFEGVEAIRDGVPAGEALPLILVSHGGLRSAKQSGSWLDATLAREGFVVVEIDAPRPTDAAAVNEIWHRADDVSRALDGLLEDKAWAGRIDPAQISVVGYALGGTAALELVGATIDAQIYVDACNGPVPSAPIADCTWYAMKGGSPADASREDLDRNRADPRIAYAVAIAPEYLDVLSIPPTLRTPVMILRLGDDGGTDTLADISAIRDKTVHDATMTDGFAVCTKRAPKILADDGQEAVLCGGSANRRESIHDKIAENLLAFLNATSSR